MSESILKRLRKEPAPLIDGNAATFIWRGKSAPGLEGDFTGWEEGDPVALKEVAPEVWTYQLILPPDAYIEYRYVQADDSVTDSLNPRVSPNGIGGYNHYFHMPEYQPTDLVQKKRRIPHGQVTRHIVETDYLVFGAQRTVYLYHPPVKHPVPLLVVWDG